MACASRLFVLFLALLLVANEEQLGPQPAAFAEASEQGQGSQPPSSGSGKGGGNSDESDSSEGEGGGSSPSTPKKPSEDKASSNQPQQGKPPAAPQKDQLPGLPKIRIPLFWNTSTSASGKNEHSENEEFNAVLSRIFDRRLGIGPRFRGALEAINDSLSQDMLELNEKMSPTERQRVMYGLGGRGSYMEVPDLLHELRQEADHPVEEKQRIRRVNAQRRRGLPINPEDLKMRPFVRKEFQGPVTTTEIEENLTEAEMQRRQAGVNGWMQRQKRLRQLQRANLRQPTVVRTPEPINDDDFEVSDEDVRGLGFKAKLSEQEGGAFASKEEPFGAETGGGRTGTEEDAEQAKEPDTTEKN